MATNRIGTAPKEMRRCRHFARMAFPGSTDDLADEASKKSGLPMADALGLKRTRLPRPACRYGQVKRSSGPDQDLEHFHLGKRRSRCDVGAHWKCEDSPGHAA